MINDFLDKIKSLNQEMKWQELEQAILVFADYLEENTKIMSPDWSFFPPTTLADRIRTWMKWMGPASIPAGKETVFILINDALEHCQNPN